MKPLVITRTKYQSIVLDGDIVVTVLKVERDKVIIGIQAPAGVQILAVEPDLVTVPGAGQESL